MDLLNASEPDKELQVERIIAVAHELNGPALLETEEAKELTQYKHCLVKWKGKDYEQATWELTVQVVNSGHAATAVKRYLDQSIQERSALYDASYRANLIASKNLLQRNKDSLLVEESKEEINLSDVEFGEEGLKLLDY